MGPTKHPPGGGRYFHAGLNFADRRLGSAIRTT